MSLEEKVLALRNRADEHEGAARAARVKARELRAAAAELEQLGALDAGKLEARKGELVARADVVAEESAALRLSGGRGGGRGGAREMGAGVRQG